ncbi:hypothetical protein EV385_5056 [Krasilnikovia cinnamomea]|uniref:Uncharacterized protein n=1 Tax=Krasilnikovia cinnamomea TaxID=349313 RepID=A0A4Q7ZQ03_9ACTN|nr:hypothetical protein [Krasilnikovia cinnamomea]RZU53170.1 hypothetical protein EV385_5056 [Krasilnikovia cinnamomea]
MPPYEDSGRHRNRSRRPAGAAEKPVPSAGSSWLRRAVLVALAVTVVIDLTLIVLHELQSRANEIRAVPVFVPAPATSSPSPSPTPTRAQPRATTRRSAHAATVSLTPVRRTPSRTASPTPPPPSPSPRRTQLLGPDNLGRALAGYCRSTEGRGTAAALTRDGWFCVRLFERPRPIDMDAACRDLYGSAARARQLDASDQRSWRCYRVSP